MIFKIQKPLATDLDELMYLAYTEDRENMMELTDVDVGWLFGAGQFKVFVEADIVGDTIAITGEAEFQSW